MIRHLVIHTLREGTEPAHVDRIVAALRALPDRIDGIVEFVVHRDAGLDVRSADIGIEAVFADATAWQAYQDHPEHQKVVHELIVPVLASRAAIQAAV